MFTTKAAAAAALLVVLGGTAACGSKSSSNAGSDAGPTNADKTSFCGTFTKLTSETTPKDAAAAFAKIGTPSDITADARHGYEVLVSKFATMADNASSSDFTAMQKSLSATDQKDVTSFLTYLAKECASALTPSDSSS